MHHCSSYLSLALLRNYDLKMPHFTFYGGRKQAVSKFLLFLNLDMVLWNSNIGESVSEME